MIVRKGKCMHTYPISEEVHSYLLAETEKLGAKPCNAPVARSLQLATGDIELFDDLEMYKLLGELNHLTITHSDIAKAISIVSQFVYSPTDAYRFCVI